MRATRFFSTVCLWAALTTTLAAAAPSGEDRGQTAAPSASSQDGETSAGLAWRILPSLKAREKSSAPSEMPRDPFLDRRPPPPMDQQVLSPSRRSPAENPYLPAPSAVHQPNPPRYPIHPVADYGHAGQDRGQTVERTHVPAATERPPRTDAENRGYHTITERGMPRHPVEPAETRIRLSDVITGRTRVQPIHVPSAADREPSVPPPVRQPASSRAVYTVKDGRLLVGRTPAGEDPRGAARPQTSLRRPRAPGSFGVATNPPPPTAAAESEADKPTLLGRMRGWLPGQGDEEEADISPPPPRPPAETASDDPSLADRLRGLKPKWMAFGQDETTVSR